MILKSNFTICDVIIFRLELIWQKYHIFLIFLIFNFFKFLPMMIWQMKIFGKYLENICTMNGAWGKKVILRFLLEHEKIWLHTKFQIYPTPRSGFLPTNPTFLRNFWKKYFSVDLFTVLHPSKLVLIILDLNWAKTRALLLQVFEISN